MSAAFALAIVAGLGLLWKIDRHTTGESEPRHEGVESSRDARAGSSGLKNTAASVPSTSGSAAHHGAFWASVGRLQPRDGRERMLLYVQVEHCRDFVLLGKAEAQRAFHREIADDTKRDVRAAAYMALKAQCDDLDGDRNALAKAAQLMREAAELGDAHAASVLLTTRWSELSLAQREVMAQYALQGVNPEALLRLASFASAHGGPSALAIADHDVSSPTHHFAWLLAACALGADCTAQSWRLLDLCAYRAACDAPNLDGAIAAISSPSSWRAIEQARDRILAAISARDFGSLGIDPARWELATR